MHVFPPTVAMEDVDAAAPRLAASGCKSGCILICFMGVMALNAMCRMAPWPLENLFVTLPKSAPDDERRVRIIYAIRTNWRNCAPKLPTVLRTWASVLKRRDLVIFSTISYSLAMGPEYTFPVRSTNCSDDRNLGLTCVEAYIQLFVDQEAGMFDWLFAVDEDVYLHTRNVERVLKTLDASSPSLFTTPGCVGKLAGQADGVCGGGGYAISRQALRMMVKSPASRSQCIATATSNQQLQQPTASSSSR